MFPLPVFMFHDPERQQQMLKHSKVHRNKSLSRKNTKLISTNVHVSSQGSALIAISCSKLRWICDLEKTSLIKLCYKHFIKTCAQYTIYVRVIISVFIFFDNKEILEPKLTKRSRATKTTGYNTKLIDWFKRYFNQRRGKIYVTRYPYTFVSLVFHTTNYRYFFLEKKRMHRLVYGKICSYI